MSGQSLARGDVVLVRFPFTDLSSGKVRPALIVGRVSGDDLVLAFITGQLIADDPRTSHPLEPTNREFRMTGLKGPSLLRLNEIATLHRDLIRRRLGKIGPQTEQAVALGLRYVFEL